MQAKITISLETDVIQALKHYAWDEYRRLMAVEQ